MTERNRNQLQQTATASGAALLPALPSVPLGSVSPDLRRFLEAVKERLEVRDGSRGNPFEAVVTKRDLASAGLLPAVMGGRSLGWMSASGGLMMRRPDGSYATLSVDEFAAQIYQSPLFQSLKRGLSAPTRFDDLPSEIKNYLLNSIADEAARRGADIRNTEFKLQTELRSLAYKVEEVTASVAQAAAGVRETTYAVAEAGRAMAGKITQVEARLDLDVPDTDKLPLPPAAPYATMAALQADVPVGDASRYYRVVNPSADADPLTDDAELLYVWDGAAYLQVGVGSVAQLEQRMTAVSSRVKGTEAQYTVKVNAGGAMAGFGLAASSPVAGEGTSAFIVQADKMAFIGTGDVLGTGEGEIDPVSPPISRVPFGVDTVNNVVYINGSLRVGSTTGPTMDSITQASGVYLTYTSQFFKYGTTGNPLNTSVTITANVTGGLEGTLAWTSPSGYAGSIPVDATITTTATTTQWTVNVADLTGDVASFVATLTAGTATYTDTVTLTKLRDGSDAYVASLTNDSAGVATNSSGVPLSGGFANATGTFEVRLGADKLSSGVTYSVASGGNPSGVTTSINASSGAFSVTAAGSWSSTSNVAKITYQAVVTNGPTLTKEFTLAKNKQGDTGAGYSGVVSGSSLTIGTGSKVFSGITNTGAYVVGQRVRVTVSGSSTNWMDGVISALSTNSSITVSVDKVSGSGAWSSWTFAAAGELGVQGAPGSTGTRGTITTKITGAWNATTAANTIAAIATASGPIPTTPIKGDIVYYTGGAKECTVAGNPGTWADVAAFIDGNLVVSGTVTASALKLTGTGAVTASTVGGVSTDLSNAPSSILNSNISISSNGALTGGGGGQVTIGGLGYTGALDATKNVVTYSSTAPASPVNGDIWVDTSVNPNVAKVRVAGAWQSAANNTTNTNQLTDGANLGQTALWSSVTNRPANLAALTGSEAIQNSLITAASINALSSNSRNALTGSAGLAIGSIAWNASGVRTSGYGIGITENGIAAFNSAGSQTFALDGTTGNASFAGTLSAASGTLGTITAGTITGTSLSVGSSPSVSGTTMTGSGAVLNNGGTFALGSSTGNITYNGTTITLNGATVVNGTLNGTAVSTVVAGAAAGATAVQPSDITSKLEASTSYTLTGVVTPADSGALKVGGITWSATTGALTGGSGIAITEAGIIGAKNGAATFSIDTSGNAIFKGDITGASGTFSGSLSAATISGGTISGTAISGSTITGATFQTAASGARTTINESSNNKIIGYDASNVQRTTIEANLGYIAVTKNASAAAIFATNTYDLQDAGDAIWGTSTNGSGVRGASTNRVGVEGRSTNYIGGAFYGGSNAPPVYINPNGSLPTSGALQGSLCVVSGKLYFHNGTTWKEVQLV